MKTQQACGAVLICLGVLLKVKRGGLALVDEIWVEDVELVALDHLGGWIVMVIVCLVVLIPLVPSVHPIEVLGFARPVLVVPPVHLQGKQSSAGTAGPAKENLH